MRVVIYESSSHGGCYNYAKEIFKAYSTHPEVKFCELIIPVHSRINESRVYKILCNDLKNYSISLVKKVYFLYRTFINPFILFFFLLRREASLVIFNDFEQLSAFIWVPFFRIFLRKHTFTVVLHDPDRDNYPPSRSFSETSMNIMMSIMKLGFFHEHLPSKIYYRTASTKFLDVPHGIYVPFSPDITFGNEIKSRIGGSCSTMAILGNIRKEKNYPLAIQSLVNYPELKLVIAGNPANQNVDVSSYKLLAEKLKVDKRVIWIERYLTDSELSSLIDITDVVLLNYSRSFTSQSGILNLIAPYKKKIIVSRGESGLHDIVSKFNIGTLIEPDNLAALIEGISTTLREDYSDNWGKYLDYASWKNHAEKVINEHKSTVKI